MLRKIIKIDEDKCNGCGLCIPACPEGAVQMIDGKARLVSDLCCDGLGACLGHCPEGAITIEEREAEPYDEIKVLEHIIPQGVAVLKAHIEHLEEHNEAEYLAQAMEFLNSKDIVLPADQPAIPVMQAAHNHQHGGCPGSRTQSFQKAAPVQEIPVSAAPSTLTHWPVQMHLISPHAGHYRNADMLLAADCVAFSLGNFHSEYLKNKKLAIACPKLDGEQRIYLQKLVALIDEAQINTLTVMIMQVPCCGGLLQLAQKAAALAKRKVPLKAIVVGVEGNILSEEWV